jgi:uncharacterized protein YjbI with pentapeptide repeats
MLVAMLIGSTASAATPRTKEQLELEKLRQEVRKLELENDRAGSTREAVLAWAPFVTVFVAVFGVAVPVLREVRQQRRQRQSELEQRAVEERRRFDDLFAQAVGNLGAETEAVRVSGAVTLHNFLRPEYEDFHEQVYSVLCANLAVDHTRLVNRFIVRGFEKALRLHLSAQANEGERPSIDLARCRLPRAELDGLELAQVDIAFAVLREASLRGTNLFRARGFEVDLAKARLTDAKLGEARLHGAVCRGAHFHNARLVSAEFRETRKQPADLTSAEFFGARLQGAHFDGAVLRGARFDNANLADARFPGAVFDEVALRGILASEQVDGEPTWRKAYFDDHIRQALETRRLRSPFAAHDAST